MTDKFNVRTEIVDGDFLKVTTTFPDGTVVTETKDNEGLLQNHKGFARIVENTRGFHPHLIGGITQNLKEILKRHGGVIRVEENYLSGLLHSYYENGGAVHNTTHCGVAQTIKTADGAVFTRDFRFGLPYDSRYPPRPKEGVPPKVFFPRIGL